MTSEIRGGGECGATCSENGVKKKKELRLNELQDLFFLSSFFFRTKFHSQINVVVIVVGYCFTEWLA
jgi:hypothetical protein